MIPFLKEITDKIINRGEDISSSIFILPSKRAAGFLKKYLSRSINATIFAPIIFSIEEFIEELSGLQIIAKEELLIKSYQSYLQTSSFKEKEDFVSYASWAITLLGDFSEIDRHLVPPALFFNYLSEIKTLEKWGVKDKQTPLIKKYLSFWSNLSVFYHRLNEDLLEDQTGYQGMVYRKASEDIEHYISMHGEKKHYFLGFNALNYSEQHIFQELLETGNTEIFWDVDDFFYKSPLHGASLFVKKYFNQWKYYKGKTPNLPKNFTAAKKITVVEAQNNIDQIKYIGKTLSSYSQEKLNNTAIVLAEEELLEPLLYSLPENVIRVNITMGSSLTGFEVVQFFNSLLKLQVESEEFLHHKSISELLNYSLTENLLENKESIIKGLVNNNNAYLTLTQLVFFGGDKNKELLELLFGNWKSDGLLAIENCKKIIALLLKNTTISPIEHTIWSKLDEIFNTLMSVLNTYEYLRDIPTVSYLFSQWSKSASLDFKGDPYSGLQIMGVLETRVLDFETVFLLSVNEGVLPTGKTNNSFITYDLKQTFNLPLYTEKDAIYTYHFYHLLQRAHEITLIYNVLTEGLSSGEKSRYVSQLETNNLPKHIYRQVVLSTSVSISDRKFREVYKTDQVMKQLQKIGKKYFSPSALTSYIRNPIEFYEQRILKINEIESVEESIAYNTLGTIVHNTLETLYKPFENTLLTIDSLTLLYSKIPSEVICQFQKEFKRGDFSKGKNHIIFEVIKKYVYNLIALDILELKKGNTIELLYIEKNLTTLINIPELDFPVYIGGKIDRVDRYNNTIRVIDYKTGKVKSNDLEIVVWGQIILDYKYSKAFQVLLYAFILSEELKFENIEAGVISFKNLNEGFLRFYKKSSVSSRSKETIISKETLMQFEDQLKKLILEIYNKECSFIEKEI